MADEKTMPPGRALVLNTLLSILISCAVFAMMSWLLLVPQMARQEAEIRALRAELGNLQSALDEAMSEPEPPAAKEGAPGSAPAAGAAAIPAAAPGGAAAAATPATAAPAAAPSAAPAPAGK